MSVISNCKWVCFLFILAFAVKMAAQQQPDSIMQLARQKAEQKDYNQAITLITDLSRQYPENKDFTLYLAQLYYWSSAHQTARDILIPLADAKTGSAEALNLLIRVDFQLQRYNDVVERSEKGRATFPSHLNFYLFQQALALDKLNHDHQALALLSQIPAEAENSKDAQYLKTQILKKRKNTVSAGYLNTSFSQPGFAPWHLAHIEYLRKSQSVAWGGRLNYGHLFGGGAAQAELIAYPKLGPRSYLDLNAGYSAAERIFPLWRFGAEWFYDQAKINYSLGARYLDFRTIQVLMLTGHFALIFKDWKAGYRHYEVQQNDSWFASHIFTIRKSFELKESYVQLDLQYGGIPYYFFSTDAFSRIKAYRIGINGMFRVMDNFFIQPVLMYEREEYVPDTFRNRYNVQFIFSKRF